MTIGMQEPVRSAHHGYPASKIIRHDSGVALDGTPDRMIKEQCSGSLKPALNLSHTGTDEPNGLGSGFFPLIFRSATHYNS